MKIDSVHLGLEDYTLNANVVKELVLARLHEDGLITTEQGENYRDNWHVVVVKPSWFTSFASKVLGKGKGYKYKLVNMGV